MKTIVNKKMKPLRVPTGGGKFLHLGPAKTGQISDGAAASAAIRRLVKAGEIEILGDEAQAQGRGGKGGAVHQATHGHPQTTMVLPKGNR